MQDFKSWVAQFKVNSVDTLAAIIFVGFLSACGGGSSEKASIESQFTLNLQVSTGGVVKASSGSIDCNSTCDYTLSANQELSLTAQALTGYEFQQWNGACSGTGVCQLSMTANRTVSATFTIVDPDPDPDPDPVEYVLNLSIDGSGSVTSSPAGIDCGNDCTNNYPAGTQIRLTATPADGYVFDHWSGSCSGNVTCNLNLSANSNVTAFFVEEAGQQTGIRISQYTAPNDAFQLGEIPSNASGITWHEGLQQYLVVQNGLAKIYRYDQNFAYLGQLRMTGINQDTEGLAFINDNQVMVVNEGNFAHKFLIDSATEIADGNLAITQGYRLLPPPPSSNAGLEGVAVRKAANGNLARIYACQEGGNGRDMRLVYFDLPAEDPLVLLSYDSNLTVVEPFQAVQAFAGEMNDLAGMTYDERTGHLIIVSQQSRKAIQVNPDTGAIVSQLNLTGAPQFEGVTIGPNGELVFVSEANWIKIYTLPE